MPRRKKPDALARAIGKRVRQLRLERKLTLEKLSYENDLASKGYLSDVEKGPHGQVSRCSNRWRVLSALTLSTW